MRTCMHACYLVDNHDEAKKLAIVQFLLHAILCVPSSCNGVLLGTGRLFDMDQLLLEFSLQGSKV